MKKKSNFELILKSNERCIKKKSGMENKLDYFSLRQ